MFVVGMVGAHRGFDLEVAEEFPGVTGVFCQNEADCFQDADGPEGDVFQVADGCGNDVKHFSINNEL